jgi:hypothetical protein
VAGHLRAAGVGALERGEDVDGGGLAGAVRAEERKDGARRHVEIDSVDDDLVAVGLAESTNVDRV